MAKSASSPTHIAYSVTLGWAIGLAALLLGCAQGTPATVVRDTPEARALAQVYFVRGLRSEEMRDQGGSRFYFERVVDLDSKNARGFYHLAMSYFAATNRRFLHTAVEDRLTDALIYYSDAIELDPKFADAYEARGFVRVEQDSMLEARKDFLTAASLDTEFVLSFNDTTWATRNAEAAVECFETQLEKKPEKAILWLKYGNACVAAGDIETALSAYGKATTVEKPFHLALLARGSMHLDLGDLESAAADFQDGLELLPDHPAALELLARCRFRQQRFTESRDLYTESLVNRRTDSSTLIQRGLAFVELGAWREALKDFSFAHKFSPSDAFRFEVPGVVDSTLAGTEDLATKELDPARLFVRATRSLQAEELSTGVEALDQCLQLEPSFALGWLVRGVIERKRGNRDVALSNFDHALSLDADLARALNNRGNVFAEQGQLAEAKSSYEAAALKAPNFAWPHRNLGLLLSETDPVAAIAALSQALMLDPTLQIAALDRAKLYQSIGNVPAAAQDQWLATSNWVNLK